MAQSPSQHGAEEKSTRTRKRARRFIFEHLHRRENDNVELKLLEKLRTCTETDPATDHQPSVNFKNENSMASCWEEEREKTHLLPTSERRQEWIVESIWKASVLRNSKPLPAPCIALRSSQTDDAPSSDTARRHDECSGEDFSSMSCRCTWLWQLAPIPEKVEDTLLKRWCIDDGCDYPTGRAQSNR